jgi:hypothetical protein
MEQKEDVCYLCNKANRWEAKDQVNFKKGDKVRYIPLHADGDKRHIDCENGVVSSILDLTVFVKYDNAECVMETGDEPFTAQATDPLDLIKR